MKSQQFLTTALVALLVMEATLVTCIPSRVANRMIPSWWYNAREKKLCTSWADCNQGECCARPMLSSHSYCLPFKSKGHSCDASALLLDFQNEIYFDSCPCQKQLTCANLHSSSVCVDTEALDEIIIEARPSPQPVKL
ncbi:uncharacterized protein [Macrobrachium rosenbergii]|uniref:uncharacterized protein n=1 Tax=Macrobrachium rosenbergii TaxID=79674 RepID=UPI0034D77F8B